MTSPQLRVALGEYAQTRPLFDGSASSPDVRLDLVRVSPVHRAFAPMVREAAYDVSELALVTAVQAVAYDRPVVVLPAVVVARPQRGNLLTHTSRPIPDPASLRGARVGVRAYAQTTGAWVRAHLLEDVGLAADEVHWVTRDPAHVEQYDDPPSVDRSLGDRDLLDALREGYVDAAVFGNDRPGGDDADELLPVWPDADQRDRAWAAEQGFVPVNHVVVVSRDLYDRDPDAVRATYDLLVRSGAAIRAGTDELAGPVRAILEAGLAQRLLPRRLSAEEVLTPADRLLE